MNDELTRTTTMKFGLTVSKCRSSSCAEFGESVANGAAKRCCKEVPGIWPKVRPTKVRRPKVPQKDVAKVPQRLPGIQPKVRPKGPEFGKSDSLSKA